MMMMMMMTSKSAMKDSLNFVNEITSQTQEDEDKIILQPVTYIRKVLGKNRACFDSLKAFNEWLEIPSDKLRAIMEILEMTHDSSLLIDDLQDGASFRKEKPVAHSIFSVGLTINSASQTLFHAIEEVMKLGHPDAIKVFNEQVLELHRGQGIEIYWRDNFLCPTEDEFLKMVVKKTGGLYKLIMRLMQLFSENKTDYSKFLALMGVYLQVLNDYRGFIDNPESEGFGEDITQGSFCFPIIHAIRADTENGEVMKILRQRSNDLETKKHCISVMENLGSFKYTRQMLENLETQIEKELAILGPNQVLRSMLDKYSTWKVKQCPTGQF